MSAIGTKQTSISSLDMSAFRRKADIEDCHAPRMQGPREPARQGKVGNVVLWAGNVGSWRLTDVASGAEPVHFRTRRSERVL